MLPCISLKEISQYNHSESENNPSKKYIFPVYRPIKHLEINYFTALPPQSVYERVLNSLVN